MVPAIVIGLLVVQAVTRFAVGQAMDHDVTIRRKAPAIFGWLTMVPVVNLLAWVYVRRRYPVVAS